MFEIQMKENGELTVSGRFDASQVGRAEEVLNRVQGGRILDCRDLDYISSAGIGVIIATYKRLHEQGWTLKLINLNDHIRQVFRYAGLDEIFGIN